MALNSEALAALRAAKPRSIVSPLVFCTPEGKSLGANFKRYWQPAVKAAGLADFRFHDLRHTFASRLVARGVSSYIVQQAAGAPAEGTVEGKVDSLRSFADPALVSSFGPATYER